MRKRGKILRDTSTGPGLLMAEGQQYSFPLEGVWQSETPPRPGLVVDLDLGEDAVLEGLEGARAYSAVSLQSLVGDGEDGTELGDLFGVEDHELTLAEYRASLGPALEALSPREQKIVVLRFFGNLTQTQIAERVGISQMHVSRMLAKSLQVLRGELSAE